MKRSLAIVLISAVLFSMLCVNVYGQNTSPIDLVLLLDTSSGMNSSYENVNNYLTDTFLTEFLRVGDTFHLIPFSARPRLDVARRINGIGDVETIIGRTLLQYPVESGSNVSEAISFAERYITNLPSRPKKIVLITTGSTNTANLVTSARQRLTASNTTIDFIQVSPGQPLTNLPVSGRAAVTRTAAPATTAQAAQTVAAAQTTTTAAAQTSSTAAATQTTPTTTSQAAQTSSTAAATQTTPTTTTQAAQTSSTAATQTTPTTTAAAQTTSTADSAQTATSTAADSIAQTAGGTGTTDSSSAGTQSTASQTTARQQSSRSGGSSLPFIIGIILLILLILALIIFLVYRKLSSSPTRVMTQASSADSKPAKKEVVSPDKRHSQHLANFAAGQTRRTTPYDNRPLNPETNKPVEINPAGPLLLNLHVDEQNTSIGKRNIHSLKSGYSLTVGGGKADDYLIFLVPIPAHIGEVRRDGSQLTFIPRKSKYFPDIGSNEVKDCINKTIRIISDKNYEMFFRFEMYEDPLISLNRLLHSVKVPG